MINPCANVFVFVDFNIHHKVWLTYCGRTYRSGELCYNFSISNDITQMVNFPTQILDCDSHSAALLDFFILSDSSICFRMAFHWESLIMLFEFSLTFDHIRNGMPHFIALHMSILILIGMVFLII